MPQPYNTYQPFAVQTIQKTNWFLYTITIIISLVILLTLNGTLTLSSGFWATPPFIICYSLISVVSLVIGAITTLILNKIANSNKVFLLGGAIISSLSAIVISLYLSITGRLAKELMVATEQEGIETSLGELFLGMPNGLLTGFLIILFCILILSSFLPEVLNTCVLRMIEVSLPGILEFQPSFTHGVGKRFDNPVIAVPAPVKYYRPNLMADGKTGNFFTESACCSDIFSG